MLTCAVLLCRFKFIAITTASRVVFGCSVASLATHSSQFVFSQAKLSRIAVGTRGKLYEKHLLRVKLRDRFARNKSMERLFERISGGNASNVRSREKRNDSHVVPALPRRILDERRTFNVDVPKIDVDFNTNAYTTTAGGFIA